MRRLLSCLIAASCAVVLAAQARTTLDIYLVDVEGGNATLFVAPSGESMLIDTGNGGAAAVRDGDRIMAAVKDAGLSQIDHLITTHYHGDHLRGDGERRGTDSDPRLHRSRCQRAAESGDRRVPAEGLSRLCTRNLVTPLRSRVTASP